MLSECAMIGYQSACCQRGGDLLAVNTNVIKTPSLMAFEINNESWKILAAERGICRSLIRKGPESYEQTRIRQAEEKRLLRKSSAAETSSAIITALPRPNCDKTFRARIGLISHIAYMRQTSDVIIIITDGWTNNNIITIS